jgi:heme-degrading monooxygenase HmoA
MYAEVSTWHYRAAHDPAFERAEVAPLVAKLTHQPGYVAGYEVTLAPDADVVVTVWESEQALDAGFRAVLADLDEAVRSRIERVERRSGPAQELGAGARS